MKEKILDLIREMIKICDDEITECLFKTGRENTDYMIQVIDTKKELIALFKQYEE